jgi:serine protease inhibitor
MSSNSPVFPDLEEGHLGLDSTRQELTDAERDFIDANNELGFQIYKNLIKREAYATSNLVFSPLSSNTLLAMLFLGARGDTSWEINEILKLDEIVTFNPHLLYKNITDSMMEDPDKVTAACVKQVFVDQVSNLGSQSIFGFRYILAYSTRRQREQSPP